MRTLGCFVVALLLGSSASAQEKKKEAFETAIDKGLEYLAGAQQADGSWPMSNRGMAFAVQGRDPSVSALCVMAFLSAGHVPGEGKYSETIIKGVRYVCSQQKANGVLAANEFAQTVMYTHGICTLMLAEIVGLMPDRTEAANIRKRLEKAIAVIRRAQSSTGENNGGWRYSTSPGDADISVSAWQVMALRAAKNVGCDIPNDTIDRAVAYIKRCYDGNTGGYRYTRYSQVTAPCTAASILSLELCGKEYHKSDESLRAANFILQPQNALSMDRPHFFYGVYYTSQGMFQIGDNYWTRYRAELHGLLLIKYPQQVSGCWIGRSMDDASVGPNYCTAMAILALTVEYRFLPIYQRGEE
jgi:hypothetical protein